MKRARSSGSSGSSSGFSDDELKKLKDELELWYYIRKRDYGGSSEAVRSIQRVEKLLAQFPSAIWALVFTHLDDGHRLAVLPLVSKYFNKICHNPESWCSTRFDVGYPSFNMIFSSSSSLVNFDRLRNIRYLCISEALLRCLKDREKNMNHLLWNAKIISVESAAEPDVIQFLHRNANNVTKLKLKNAHCDPSRRLIPEIFLTRCENWQQLPILFQKFQKFEKFEKLISVSFKNHRIIDCDLFVFQFCCPSLVSLHLGTSLTDATREGFDALSECSKLKILTVRLCNEFRFSRLIFQLQKLTFERWDSKAMSEAMSETPTSIVPWPTRQLKTLCLREGGPPFCNISNFTDYPQLELPQTIELEIEQKHTIEEEEFVYLLKRNPKLEILTLLRGCPKLKKQSTFDLLIQGNLSVLNFGFAGDQHLGELIFQTRKKLCCTHSLTVAVAKYNKKLKKKIIQFTFTFQKEKCDWKSLLEWNVLSKLMNRESICIPNFLTIHASTWLPVT